MIISLITLYFLGAVIFGLVVLYFTLIAAESSDDIVHAVLLSFSLACIWFAVIPAMIGIKLYWKIK